MTQRPVHEHIVADAFFFKKSSIGSNMFNLTLMTPERRHWRCSGVFIINFEHIFTPSSSAFIVDFEQVMFAEIVRYFSSFTRRQKFHQVFLKHFTHFLTHSRYQSLSCRSQSIWFAFNMSKMWVWNELRTPSLWNKRECGHSNSHIWTENKKRIQNPVKHVRWSILEK